MLKVILNAPNSIAPFNEPARDLRIQNHPLWLHQRNVLAPYTTRELELKPGQRLPLDREEQIVYRDNLFFDDEYIRAFLTAARKKGSRGSPECCPAIRTAVGTRRPSAGQGVISANLVLHLRQMVEIFLELGDGELIEEIRPGRQVQPRDRLEDARRFGIEPQNIATASRLIREAVDARLVVPYDPDAAPKLMRYMPVWAASHREHAT